MKIRPGGRSGDLNRTDLRPYLGLAHVCSSLPSSWAGAKPGPGRPQGRAPDPGARGPGARTGAPGRAQGRATPRPRPGRAQGRAQGRARGPGARTSPRPDRGRTRQHCRSGRPPATGLSKLHISGFSPAAHFWGFIRESERGQHGQQALHLLLQFRGPLPNVRDRVIYICAELARTRPNHLSDLICETMGGITIALSLTTPC